MHPDLAVIQSWPKPNYINPETRGPALTIVNIIFIILVFLIVGLRYYTRLRITRSFGTDDIVIGLSVVSWQVVGVVYIRLTYPDPHLCIDSRRSDRRQQFWLGQAFMGSEG